MSLLSARQKLLQLSQLNPSDINTCVSARDHFKSIVLDIDNVNVYEELSIQLCEEEYIVILNNDSLTIESEDCTEVCC